jgi:hypothetical protein
LLQDREDKGRLERIVVHEEDACHVPRLTRPNLRSDAPLLLTD